MRTRQEIERLSRQKRKRQLLLILLSVFAVALTAMILLLTLLPENEATVPGDKTPPEIIEGLESLNGNYAIAYPTMEEGQIKKIKITNKNSYKDNYNSVEDAPETSYVLERKKDANGKFVLTFWDEEGNEHEYRPEILSADSSFDYESLYAIEQNDGYNRIHKLTYLCIALELPYFDERINLKENAEERARQLRHFGLDEPQTKIEFEYEDEKGNRITRRLAIGDRNITGLGYYFMVDDRPYVYNSTSNHFDYALLGFADYVNPILVAAGLPEDKGLEPYYVSKYEQWLNETVKEEGEIITDGSTVIAYTDIFEPLESKLDKADYEKDTDRFFLDELVIKAGCEDGYINGGYSQIEIDLRNKEDYKRFINALVGKQLGTYYDEEAKVGAPDDRITVTLTYDEYGIDFSGGTKTVYEYEIVEIESVMIDGVEKTDYTEKIGKNNIVKIKYNLKIDGVSASDTLIQGKIDLSDSQISAEAVAKIRELTLGALSDENKVTFTVDYSKMSYSYEVIEIESILTDGEDITEKGTAVGANNLIKIAYYLTIGGKKVSNIPYHGVIDLSNSNFDAGSVEKLRALSVGELAATDRVTLSVDYIAENVDYTKDNTVFVNLEYRVIEILAIYDAEGKNSVSKVAEDSQVLYRYAIVKDGKELGYGVNVADNTEVGKLLKENLIGLSAQKNLSVSIGVSTQYCELVQKFTTYEIARTDYFIKHELVSSFKYLNRSEIDPFYSESTHKNLLDNDYKFYGMDTYACDQVSKVLGGISIDGASGEATGLIGSEIVAVGITPAVKDRYGLYAHTVYYELPRGIIEIENGEDDTVNDVTSAERLGFTLFISEVQPDGTRYVGSDLYDLVAKVSAEKLEFLDYSFVDFWSRKVLMMFKVDDLASMNVEFMMDDVKGKYLFNLEHSDRYLITDENGKTSSTTVKPDNYTGRPFNFITVFVKPVCNCGETECVCTETKLGDMLDESGKPNTTLAALYNKYVTESDSIKFGKDGFAYIGNDTAGTAYFRTLFESLFATKYTGTLTEEEQAMADGLSPLMRITVKLNSEHPDSKGKFYAYEFYRIDDRRVMVRLFNVNAKGETVTEGNVTDAKEFYISTATFKKIVSNYFTLLNAGEIDVDKPYGDLSN